MQQLTLDLFDQPTASLSSFIVGRNTELMHYLTDKVESPMFIWGESGCGKTHLLTAWLGVSDNLKTLYIGNNKNALFSIPEYLPVRVAVDDIHLCDEKQEVALFAAFNYWRDAGVEMLFSANVPPQRLPLREDLRTRMAWGMVYEIQPLTDEEKICLLSEWARKRQLYIDENVFYYLLRYISRNMLVLIDKLQKLDDYSLSCGRKITLPLLQQFLRENK
ncbi:MAG: DnaA regulatory inactivator Hda [Neisseriaceae bacterium]|nr:DnaA regulatory inactivator Hda [Neisseriaceae bacterium]